MSNFSNWAMLTRPAVRDVVRHFNSNPEELFSIKNRKNAKNVLINAIANRFNCTTSHKYATYLAERSNIDYDKNTFRDITNANGHIWFDRKEDGTKAAGIEITIGKYGNSGTLPMINWWQSDGEGFGDTFCKEGLNQHEDRFMLLFTIQRKDGLPPRLLTELSDVSEDAKDHPEDYEISRVYAIDALKFYEYVNAEGKGQKAHSIGNKEYAEKIDDANFMVKIYGSDPTF